MEEEKRKVAEFFLRESKKRKTIEQDHVAKQNFSPEAVKLLYQQLSVRRIKKQARRIIILPTEGK